MITFEDEMDSVSIEVIPQLNEWRADLILSNNFIEDKHRHYCVRTINFHDRKLGIMQFNIFDSYGEALNGYDFERQYLIDRHKDNPERESIMKEWENQGLDSRQNKLNLKQSDLAIKTTTTRRTSLLMPETQTTKEGVRL